MAQMNNGSDYNDSAHTNWLKKSYDNCSHQDLGLASKLLNVVVVEKGHSMIGNNDQLNGRSRQSQDVFTGDGGRNHATQEWKQYNQQVDQYCKSEVLWIQYQG